MSRPSDRDGGRGEPPARLDALRGGRGGAFDAAYRSLRDELERYAREIAGPRARQAEYQPESIVASVLAKDMQAAIDACENDQHLAGRLKLAVRHGLLDRVERHRPEAFGGESPIDPRDGGAGPSTIAGRADEHAANRAALERLLRRLEEATMHPTDRALVDHYVIERLEWAEIADRLGMTVGAARVAMKRLRDRILPRIFAPIEARLDADDWRIGEAMFVRRLSIAELVAERVARGQPADERSIRAAASERIVPAVIAEWGGESTELILRLTGHRR